MHKDGQLKNASTLLNPLFETFLISTFQIIHNYNSGISMILVGNANSSSSFELHQLNSPTKYQLPQLKL